MSMASEFPRKSVLCRGAILHATINATMIAQSAEFSRYLSWDGRNYVINRADGTYGAVTFDETCIVGVFFDVDSKYNPFRSREAYNVERFFDGMPARQRAVAEAETLQYNRQSYRGNLVSLVTAAFWDKGEYLTAAFPWHDVLENGARIIQVELTDDLDSALEEWRDAYQMSPGQVSLARDVFEQRITNPEARITLTREELSRLEATANEGESIAECRRAFEALRVQFPS